MPTVQDWLGNLYSVYNMNGATFQDHNGALFTLTGPSSGARGGGVPGGRLTLTSATPVMTAASTAAQTTVYYTPYASDIVPIYNGTSFVPTTFSELSNLSTATTVGNAGPAAVANTSNYDYFVWLNSSSAVSLVRGPAWTSATGRGTGAGTTQLTLTNGTYLNTVAITNGPAALMGTYVGTAHSNSTATFDWIFGGVAAGGTPARFHLWNMYNRVVVDTGTIGESTDSWASSGTATWRQANGAAGMQMTYVCGLAEDAVRADYACCCNALNTHRMSLGIGVDATNAYTGRTASYTAVTATASILFPLTAHYGGIPGLGFHTINAIEFASTSSAGDAFYGDGGAAGDVQGGLNVAIRA